MPETRHFFARSIPPRPTFDKDITPEEGRVMNEHFAYLQGLTAKGKIVVAGPAFEPLFGLYVLEAISREEADHIMQNDPAIKAGIHRYELQEMHVALRADYIRSERYVTDPSDRILVKSEIIPGPLSEVWRAWTTDDGLKSFFSPHSHVELRPGGPIEILFLMDNPYGLQGSEDCHILSHIPEQMLSFEWNAPPEFGPLRDKRTIVVINFEQTGENATRILFHHLGWGKGDDWDRLFDYFDRAWGYVLGNLSESCENKAPRA